MIEVTPDNYSTAETSKTFQYYSKLATVNEFYHYRKLTPLDNQGVVRMNRDALYSGAIVDTKGGATITVPETEDDRYVSVMVTDNDMYIPQIIHKAGTYDLSQDTRYLFVVLRVQIFNPTDSDEVQRMHKVQDQFVINASSAEPYTMPDYNMDELQILHDKYNAEFAKYKKYPDEWAGKKSEVDDNSRRLAVAGAWGLFPNYEATYINYDDGDMPADKVYKATYSVPENRAFWSITMYGKDGKMHRENCILNSHNTKFNDDGTFTVYFGPKDKCPADAQNQLDTTEGWNFLFRVYLPGKEVLDGSFTLPEVTEV